MNKIRHAERRETLAFWPARDEQSGEAVGLVTDLSEEGVCIHSHARFEAGQRLNLRVAVDPKITGASAIHLHIENAWCHPSGMTGCFHSGFKLINLSFEARDGIQKLVSAFSYPVPKMSLD